VTEFKFKPVSTTRYVVTDYDRTVYDGEDVEEARKAWAASQFPQAFAYTTMTYSLPLYLGPEVEQPPIQTRWQRATRSLGKIVFPWR